MTTSLQLIGRSLRLLGVYATGENPTSTEANDGLSALNAMISGMANDNLLLFTQVLDVISLKSGQGAYLVGPSGDVKTARPLRIDMTSYVNYQDVSFQLAVLTLEEYNKIPVKNWSSPFPLGIWYQETWPNMTVTCYPTPSSDCDLYLWSWKALPAFSSLFENVSLPPGYEEMLAFNLAEALAPEYMLPVPPEVAKKAAFSKKSLAATNFTPAVMDIPSSLSPGHAGFSNALLTMGSSIPQPSPQVECSEWILYSGKPTYVSPNSFSVYGDATSIFQINRRVQVVNAVLTQIYAAVRGVDYSQSSNSTTVFVQQTTPVSLDISMNVVYFAMLSATNPSMPTIYVSIDSPAFTGTPTAPTPPDIDDSTRLATTAWGRNVFAPIDSPSFTGMPRAPTPGDDDNSERVATTKFVVNTRNNDTFPPTKDLNMGGYRFLNMSAGVLSGDSVTVGQLFPYAKLLSPSFSGNPTAPTTASTDNSTAIATTAFVKGFLNLSVPVGFISGMNIQGQGPTFSVTSGAANCGPSIIQFTRMAKSTQAWATGRGKGSCLDGAGAIINTWYFIYLILNPTTSEYDIGISTKPPVLVVLPTGYVYGRYIGMISTISFGPDKTTNFNAITSFGSRFWYSTPVNANPENLPFPGSMKCGPTATNYKLLSAPPSFNNDPNESGSIKVFGSISIYAKEAITSSTPVYVGNTWQSPLSKETVPGYGDMYITPISVNNGARVNSYVIIDIDENGQIETFAPGATVYCDMTIRGWEDDRGTNGGGFISI